MWLWLEFRAYLGVPTAVAQSLDLIYLAAASAYFEQNRRKTLGKHSAWECADRGAGLGGVGWGAAPFPPPQNIVSHA